MFGLRECSADTTSTLQHRLLFGQFQTTAFSLFYLFYLEFECRFEDKIKFVKFHASLGFFLPLRFRILLFVFMVALPKELAEYSNFGEQVN